MLSYMTINSSKLVFTTVELCTTYIRMIIMSYLWCSFALYSVHLRDGLLHHENINSKDFTVFSMEVELTERNFLINMSL